MDPDHDYGSSHYDDTSYRDDPFSTSISRFRSRTPPPGVMLNARGSQTGSIFQEAVWPPPTSEKLVDPMVLGSSKVDLGSIVDDVMGPSTDNLPGRDKERDEVELMAKRSMDTLPATFGEDSRSISQSHSRHASASYTDPFETPRIQSRNVSSSNLPATSSPLATAPLLPEQTDSRLRDSARSSVAGQYAAFSHSKLGVANGPAEPWTPHSEISDNPMESSTATDFDPTSLYTSAPSSSQPHPPFSFPANAPASTSVRGKEERVPSAPPPSYRPPSAGGGGSRRTPTSPNSPSRWLDRPLHKKGASSGSDEVGKAI